MTVIDEPKNHQMTEEKTRPGKYTPEVLLPVLRKAAAFRQEMLDVGFTDNGGAIHSAERILNTLSLRVKYPDLGHMNKLKNYPRAEFSPAALKAFGRGEKVQIEHVSPHREYTRKVISLINEGADDSEVLRFIRDNYRLVLLTPDETLRLNRINRSKLDPQRLENAGISIA